MVPKIIYSINFSFPLKGLLIAGLLAIILTGQQIPHPTPVPETLLERGQRLWVNGDFDSAYVVYRQAQAAAVSSRDTLSLTASLRQSGKYLARNGYLDEAELTLDSAIAFASVVGSLNTHVLAARCERADVEASRGKLEATVGLYRTILHDCEQLPPSQDSLHAVLYSWYSNALSTNGDLDEALVNAQKSLDILQRVLPKDHLEIAFAENSLAVIYSYLDQTETAITHMERALAIFETRLRPGHSYIVRARSNLSAMFRDRGLPWEALEMIRNNLPLLDSLSPSAQFFTLYNCATNQIVIGDFRQGLHTLDRLELFLKEHPNVRADGLSLLYYERGAAYQSLGQYDSALICIRATLAQDAKVYGKQHEQLTMDYFREGKILSLMGNQDAAIVSLNKALNLAEQHLEPFALRKAWILEGIGEVNLLQKKPQEALLIFAKAIHIYQQLEAKWNLTDSYRGLANAWREIGNTDSNQFYLRLAWQYVVPEIAFSPAPGPEVNAFWARTTLSGMLHDQGLGMEMRHAASGSMRDLQAALACYRAEIAVADSQRRYFESAGSRQDLAASQLTVVEKAISLDLKLYEATGEEGLLKDAFALAEKHKAGLLRDHTSGQYALKFAGVPDSLVRQERYFRQRMAYLQVPDKAEDWTDEDLVSGRKDAFDLYRQYQDFLRELEKDYPRYYQLKFPDSDFSFEKVAQSLPKSTALYSYFWGEEQVFVFRVFEGKLTLNAWDGDSLAKDFDPWLACISHPPGTAGNPEELQASVRRLSKALLPGKINEDTRLLISPAGKLAYLPFESLLLSEVTTGIRDWDFLVKKYPVAYTPSAEIWVQEQQYKPGKARVNYVGVAPDFSKKTAEGSAFGPLSFNQEEVRQAAEALHGKAYLGVLASEAIVKQAPQTPQLLHFATHALADESALLQSRLFLEPDSDQAEDGVLHAFEIYQLQLNSPLIVLSACQTGAGPVVQGEGVMSLARAFQFAGSRQVVTTLWNADDRSSFELMTRFFKALVKGLSAEDALSFSRKAWLATADNFHSHPYFWAGMVVVGEGGPMQFVSGINWALWGVGIAALLVLLAAGWWSRRHIFFQRKG